MSFQQKGISSLLAILVLVYGWYFLQVLSRAFEQGVDQVEYKALLMITIGITVVLSIVAQIIIAASRPAEAGEVDERDRKISLLSSRIAGIFLFVCVFSVLGLLMSGAHIFWIAQALIASLALSDIVMRAAMLIYYQRGV